MTKTKLTGYVQLARLDKPIGIYLLLWPTYWALFIAAQGWPSAHIFIVFTLGVVLTRSAGCVINDYADRKVDGSVERTAQRPLVTGVVSEKEAIGFFCLLMLIAFGLVLTLDVKTVLLSFVALALAFTYPFMKRFTYLPQFVLGAAFSWGIPMAFMATQGHIPWYAWLLYVANLLWTVAYDTQYAMVDRNDDVKIGVKSTAILFGKYDLIIIAFLQVSTLCCLALVGQQLALSWPYQLAIISASIMFAYHQMLIKNRERQACFKAFLHNHYVGLVIAVGLLAHYML
ncbi:4-hydroxybenzoate octaprenyltransferase [Aestuariibacter sp. AA17]|uniref:4-hydroxybenzoate octaprenyltransferase n=1 Tax=Fluctibacter corallii TaxID=2984329 RepID=A0ABT3AC36_9ALTE|nr:4-hydroxybenzoate octaprenyltransferase [Aestuariibacter sp. AA17]MCV2886175.1 4-hydroxybenzoate octaprenyltransferase [Aestuariibacter sp. AA17]